MSTNASSAGAATDRSVAPADPGARRDELIAFARELRGCEKCALAGSRTQVVFGSGNADADLMFVGEAPGVHEDRTGKPFVGQAGKLLDRLLADIGLDRGQCFIANVLKCRPPGNRDPQPDEIDACKGHLVEQVRLIQPRVVCTLGNFATKLLSGRPDGITRVHGTPQVHEIAGRTVFLFPIFHPAAALYTPAMLETLRADFKRLPALLAQDSGPAGEIPAPAPMPEPTPPPIPEPTPPPIPEPTPPPIPEPTPPRIPEPTPPRIPEPTPPPIPEPTPPPELVGAPSGERAEEAPQLGLF